MNRKMKYYLLPIWSVLDRVYYMFNRLTYLDKNVDGKRNIFRVKLTRYNGRDVLLADGIQIKKNDFLVKIHLHNVRLLTEIRNIKGEIRKGKFIYQCVESSLPGLVSYICSHQRKDEIKGIIGITTLNKGSSRLGFESFQIKNRYYKWFKFISFIPICLLFSTYPFRTMLKQPPTYLFMSKESLVEKYRKP